MIEDAWSIMGGQPLRGSVKLAGSKNGALPTLAATLLLDGEAVLHNVPEIADVECMLELLSAFGLTVVREAGGSVRVVNRGLEAHRVPLELVRRMRASHYLLGPVVARLGRAEIPFPGGCAIGERPIGYILEGLEALGAEARVDEVGVRLRAKRLVGASICLNPAFRSPGATFNVLMAASLAQGTTVIENASFEPDIVTFCHYLNAAGAQVRGAGTSRLEVTGVAALGSVQHTINADRLEAGTFFCAAGATRGEVTAEGVRPGELAGIADKLQEAGVVLEEMDRGLKATCSERPVAVSVVAKPFPHFPTDLQPPMAAMLATAEGISRIHDSIFDMRLQYVEPLLKMGADMRQLDARTLEINGVPRLHGARVEGHNIRDGAALVVAALGAEGESVVAGRHLVARGYQDFEGKLRSLGAEIEIRG
jgi:UDP-N-acetylglucosamine 1-carboxyvinyltransferase